MSKLELTQKIANIHNTLAQILVSGDNAIAMGGVLIELRQMVNDLQIEIQTEEKAKAEEEEKEKNAVKKQVNAK